MIKAKVSNDYKDIERIFAGGTIQKEIIKVWSTEANDYVFEAWKVLEMEGPLPLTFNANGEPLIDYRIYGNAEQTGTPTPENPIMPIGCGEKTENLFDKDAQDPDKGYINSTLMYDDGSVASAASYRVSEYIPVVSNTDYYLTDVNINGTYPSVCFYDENKVYISGMGYTRNPSLGITTPSGTAYLRMTTAKSVTGVSMLTAGSTAPTSYIPYGYKLPILSNSTATNIYIGDTPLAKDEYADSNTGKIYRIVNGTLTPTDPPVPLPQIPTIAGTNVIDYDGGEKCFITSDGYELVDKNQNSFLLSGSTDSTLCPEKMYIKYKGR